MANNIKIMANNTPLCTYYPDHPGDEGVKCTESDGSTPLPLIPGTATTLEYLQITTNQDNNFEIATTLLQLYSGITIRSISFDIKNLGKTDLPDFTNLSKTLQLSVSQDVVSSCLDLNKIDASLLDQAGILCVCTLFDGCYTLPPCYTPPAGPYGDPGYSVTFSGPFDVKNYTPANFLTLITHPTFPADYNFSPNFTYLTTLDLSKSTNLNSPNFTYPPNLTVVTLPSSIIDLTKWHSTSAWLLPSSLTTLTLTSTQISSLNDDFSTITQLTTLNLPTGLTSFSAKLPLTVKSLILPTTLKTLDLSNTPTSMLTTPLSSLTSLSNLTYGSIPSVPPGLPPSLQTLNLVKTTITTLSYDFSTITKLATLTLPNALTSFSAKLPATVQGLALPTTLITLDLSNTPTSVLVNTKLSSLINLTTLTIGSTVSDLSSWTFPTKSLITLSLATTAITTLSTDFVTVTPSLITLTLPNKLTSFSAKLPGTVKGLTFPTTLETLDLFNTPSSALLNTTLSNLTSLTSLRIGPNVTSLDGWTLPLSLQTLDLSQQN